MKSKTLKRINKIEKLTNDLFELGTMTNEESRLVNKINTLANKIIIDDSVLTGCDKVAEHFKKRSTAILCHVSDTSEEYAKSDTECTRSIVSFSRGTAYPFTDSQGTSWTYAVPAPKAPVTESLFA